MAALNGIIAIYLCYSFYLCITLRFNESEEMSLIKEPLGGWLGRVWFLLGSCLTLGLLPLALIAIVSIKKKRTTDKIENIPLMLLKDSGFEADRLYYKIFAFNGKELKDIHKSCSLSITRPPKYMEDKSWRIDLMQEDDCDDLCF